jgi:hypothetical protein
MLSLLLDGRRRKEEGGKKREREKWQRMGGFPGLELLCCMWHRSQLLGTIKG